MTHIFKGLLPVAAAISVAIGCGETDNSRDQATGPQPSGDSPYLLSSEPAGATGVAEALRIVGVGEAEEDMVVLGRVGGDRKPFVDGLAAFLIVDPELPPCRPDCGCPTPWDYCCDLNKLPEYRAMVKVVDDRAEPLTVDARKLLGIQELSTVAVRGRVKRDEAGNLTVLATGVYIRQP